MATLPRTAAVAAAAATSRHTYERTGDSFDAGLNTSTAWTEHLDRTTEYGGDSGDEIEEESRPARVLYDFQGKTEFGEL
jgi:sorting nexin-9/18/33